MKKFKRKFDTYELGKHRPIAIELDREGLGKYREYAENPIYYRNCLQYMGGELYRAILGYETIWDKQAEADLMLALDYVLTDFRERELYYIEEMEIVRDFKMHGIKWVKSVPPKELDFNLQWPFDLKRGEKVTVRVNLLDRPNHVDIERGNGEVFTIQFLRYEKFKERCKRDERQRTKRDTGTNAKGPAKEKSTGLVRRFGEGLTIRSLPPKLYRLR